MSLCSVGPSPAEKEGADTKALYQPVTTQDALHYLTHLCLTIRISSSSIVTCTLTVQNWTSWQLHSALSVASAYSFLSPWVCYNRARNFSPIFAALHIVELNNDGRPALAPQSSEPLVAPALSEIMSCLYWTVLDCLWACSVTKTPQTFHVGAKRKRKKTYLPEGDPSSPFDPMSLLEVKMIKKLSEEPDQPVLSVCRRFNEFLSYVVEGSDSCLLNARKWLPLSVEEHKLEHGEVLSAIVDVGLADLLYIIRLFQDDRNSNHDIFCFCWHEGPVKALHWYAMACRAYSHLLQPVAASSVVHGNFKYSVGVGADWSAWFSFRSRGKEGKLGIRSRIGSTLLHLWRWCLQSFPSNPCSIAYECSRRSHWVFVYGV